MHSETYYKQLAAFVKSEAQKLGFQQIGISDINLEVAEARLQQWLANKFHGSMNYMEKHGEKRSRPGILLPGTVRVISVRMDYLPENDGMIGNLQQRQKAYIARYALGRDYHKVLRQRLKQLAEQIQQHVSHQYRVFVDSAPVLEKAIAEKAGLGWIGKNTLVINQKAGSWFFLGEIYTDLPLPIDESATNHCGSCQSCLKICPTEAIVAPYQLDARRCISYLTIENKGPIPIEFRPLIGNRIFGCDDCQIICPWNKFARHSQESDFKPRHVFSDAQLIDLFQWSEAEFLKNTEGSAIRRTGYEGWLRNLAVALGNARASEEILTVLRKRLNEPLTSLVEEHIQWAIEQHNIVKPQKLKNFTYSTSFEIKYSK